MFVTFEGLEGSGKSTVIAKVAAHLRNLGKNVVTTREPGGSSLGNSLRSLLLDRRHGKIAPAAELYLFLADRAQHIDEIIIPAIRAGQIVLCDRYEDSTIAYQGYGRGMNLRFLENALGDIAIKPDVTVLLDLPVAEGLRRARERNKILGLEQKEGRFEAEELAFHERVASGYRELAARYPDRIRTVDASTSAEEVYSRCLSILGFADAL